MFLMIIHKMKKEGFSFKSNYKNLYFSLRGEEKRKTDKIQRRKKNLTGKY